ATATQSRAKGNSAACGEGFLAKLISSRGALSRIRRHRWVRIGPIELGVSLPVATDRRLASSLVTRRLIKPLLRMGERKGPPQAEAWAPPDEPIPERRPSPSAASLPERRLLDRVAGMAWEQTIDLGDGVVTPGVRDLRGRVPLHQLPSAL